MLWEEEKRLVDKVRIHVARIDDPNMTLDDKARHALVALGYALPVLMERTETLEQLLWYETRD